MQVAARSCLSGVAAKLNGLPEKESRPAGRLAFAIAIACAIAGAGCGTGKASGDQQAASQTPPATPVQIQVARAITIQDTTDYVATLKSRHSAIINPQVDGQVTEIYVHSGERVAAGAPLVQIDPLKQEATVHSGEYARAGALANLRYAREQQERISKLYAAGVVSKQSLDEAQASLDAAEAQLHSLDAQVREQQVQLRYYKVLAPTGGIVGDVPVRVGDRVTSSTHLTTVDQPGELEVYIQVPIERASELRMNNPVQVLDSLGSVVADGKIDFISPEVDDQTQSILVKSRVSNRKGALRTLQFIRARVVWGSHEGPVIPVLAVSRINGQYFAYVADGANGALVARQRQVRLGQMIGNDYVVLDGIKPGDRLIVSGTQNLIDGTPVVPQR
jgi:RND family efflux transporter MFP subunit